MIVCPNAECEEFTVKADLKRAGTSDHVRYFATGDPIAEWQLRPQSQAKPFPSYIPEPIRADYEEACAIAHLSPKASATLARRCLQGMFGDFWGVRRGNLAKEIEALEEKVDPTTWGAIDAVRSIGNIGAHMEKDINLIIDVEPEEATMLIELIEQLFTEWYVHKHERSLRMQKIVATAAEKAAARAGKPALPEAPAQG